MHTLVLYNSKYGNTRRIAETVAGILNTTGLARTTSFDQFSTGDLQDADLVIVGSPTYYQAVPKAVRVILKTIPKQSLKGRWVASFDTSLRMWGPIMLMTAAHGIMSRLKKLGGKKLINPMTFIVKSMEVPSGTGELDMLEDGEMARAQDWAHEIEERFTSRGKL